MCVFYTYPWHKGEDVVFLVFDGVFGVLLLTFFRVAEPDGSSLQLLLPPAHVSQILAAAEVRKSTRERRKSNQ